MSKVFCTACHGTKRIKTDSPCYYNCEGGGVCKNVTDAKCEACGTLPCPLCNFKNRKKLNQRPGTKIPTRKMEEYYQLERFGKKKYNTKSHPPVIIKKSGL